MTQAKFDVYIGATHTDTVFFDGDMPARDVRRSLIDHDGYPSTISVYRMSRGKNYAYDDMARASHPEEL